MLDQSLRGYSQKSHITEFFSRIVANIPSFDIPLAVKTSSLLRIGPPGTTTKYHLEKGTQPGPFAGSVRSCARVGSLPLIWLNLGMTPYLNGVTCLLNDGGVARRYTERVFRAFVITGCYPVIISFRRYFKILLPIISVENSGETLTKSTVFCN